MEYMLFSTDKYNFFQSRNPGIWALPMPGFGIEKNVRDPGIRDPGKTIPNRIILIRSVDHKYLHGVHGRRQSSQKDVSMSLRLSAK